MNWEEIHIDHIDDELRKNLDNGQDASTNPSLDDGVLKEARRHVRLMQDAIRLGHMQKQLSDLQTLERERSTPSGKSRSNESFRELTTEDTISSPNLVLRRRIMIGITAAAAVALIFWIAFNPYFGTQSEPFEHTYLIAHFDDYLVHPDVPRSNDRSMISLQERAYNLYSLRDFEAAIPLLEKLWEEEGDQIALFYLIVSYYGMGDQERAMTIYNDHRPDFPQQYIDKITKLLL